MWLAKPKKIIFVLGVSMANATTGKVHVRLFVFHVTRMSIQTESMF
jgi:hypothetical protein